MASDGHEGDASGDWKYCVRGGKARAAKMPRFPWTGCLRPHPIGRRRNVPEHIARPDYAMTGIPKGEIERGSELVVRTAREIEGMRAAGKVGRQILDAACAMVKPGTTTDEIDRVVHDLTIELGAYPSPLNYYSFPKSVCASVNEVICHGIPDSRELDGGDVVDLDVTCFYQGFHGDLNETHVVDVDAVDDVSKKLIRTTYECLEKAIDMVRPGVKFRDLGKVISRHASRNGFSVVRDYCGHGIGDLFHCAPSIPHYAGNKARGVMKAGMTFTIEPMINAGSWDSTIWPDGWTVVTVDGKRSAQFEHTLLCTETGCEVLTARTPTSPPLWWEQK